MAVHGDVMPHERREVSDVLVADVEAVRAVTAACVHVPRAEQGSTRSTRSTGSTGSPFARRRSTVCSTSSEMTGRRPPCLPLRAPRRALLSRLTRPCLRLPDLVRRARQGPGSHVRNNVRRDSPRQASPSAVADTENAADRQHQVRRTGFGISPTLHLPRSGRREATTSKEAGQSGRPRRLGRLERRSEICPHRAGPDSGLVVPAAWA